MKKINLMIMMLLVTLVTFGQDKTIQGQITMDGARVPGVSVFVKNTTIGTASNSEGFYELTIPQNTDSIIFKFIGAKTQTIVLNGKTLINIELQEESTELAEIQIRGFATATTLARRRIENLQSIPEAISAFGSEDIENAGIEGITDFVNSIPNATLVSRQNIGTNSLTVRGITQLKNAEAPVAIVIDGINVPNPSMLDVEMFDIEQMELVKGPQGALYGRNAIGGALNITTKKPTNRYSHFLRTGYASGNTFNTVLGSSGSIVKEKLLYRISAAYKDSKGLIENDFLKEKVDFYNNKSVRGQLTFNITDNFVADIVGNYTDTEGGATYYALGNSELLTNLGAANGITEVMNAENTSLKPIGDELGISERQVADVSLRLNLALPFARLTSSTAFSKIGYDYSGDLDFSPLRELLQEQTLKSDAINQELRLTSNINEHFNWVLGAFYQTDTRKVKTLGSLSSAGILAGVFGLPQTDLANEILYPLIDAEEENQNTTLAFFGQASYKFNSQTEFALGLRYDNDIRKQTDLKTSTTREHTFNQIQPKVNISQQVNENIFAFVSYSRGYRSGGYNAPTVIRYPELYEAEFSDNYEIGIKTNWLNNRLIFNTNVFVTTIQNTQLFFVELDGGGQIIVNMGETRNIGAEADVKFRITNNFDIYASVGFINPEILKDGITVPESFGNSFEGNYAPQINLNNTNLALQYRIPIGKTNSVFLRAAYEHRGKLYWHPDNSDIQPETDFINLNISYTHKAKLEWKVEAFVENLLNENYSSEYAAVEYTGAVFGDLRWPGQPRILGINISVKF